MPDQEEQIQETEPVQKPEAEVEQPIEEKPEGETRETEEDKGLIRRLGSERDRYRSDLESERAYHQQTRERLARLERADEQRRAPDEAALLREQERWAQDGLGMTREMTANLERTFVSRLDMAMANMELKYAPEAKHPEYLNRMAVIYADTFGPEGSERDRGLSESAKAATALAIYRKEFKAAASAEIRREPNTGRGAGGKGASSEVSDEQLEEWMDSYGQPVFDGKTGAQMVAAARAAGRIKET